jgi:hypothetical protein
MILISIRKNYEINYRETNPITFNHRLPHGFPDSYATFDPEKKTLCAFIVPWLSPSLSPLITVDPLIFTDPLHSLSVSFFLSCETRQRDPSLFSLSLSLSLDRNISPALALVAYRDFAPFLRSLPFAITLTPFWLPCQLWNSLISWTLLTFSLSLSGPYPLPWSRILYLWLLPSPLYKKDSLWLIPLFLLILSYVLRFFHKVDDTGIFDHRERSSTGFYSSL